MWSCNLALEAVSTVPARGRTAGSLGGWPPHSGTLPPSTTGCDPRSPPPDPSPPGPPGAPRAPPASRPGCGAHPPGRQRPASGAQTRPRPAPTPGSAGDSRCASPSSAPAGPWVDGGPPLRRVLVRSNRVTVGCRSNRPMAQQVGLDGLAVSRLRPDHLHQTQGLQSPATRPNRCADRASPRWPVPSRGTGQTAHYRPQRRRPQRSIQTQLGQQIPQPQLLQRPPAHLLHPDAARSGTPPNPPLPSAGRLKRPPQRCRSRAFEQALGHALGFLLRG